MVRIGVTVAIDQSWEDHYTIRQTKRELREAIRLLAQHFPQIEPVIHQPVVLWESPKLPFFGNYPDDIASALAQENSPEKIVEAMEKEKTRLGTDVPLYIKHDVILHDLQRRKQPERRAGYIRGVLGHLLARTDTQFFLGKLLVDLQAKYPRERREFLFGFTGQSLTQERTYEAFGMADIGSNHIICKIPPVNVNPRIILVHEFGHALGGKHTQDANSFMNPNYRAIAQHPIFDPENMKTITDRISSL